jgi:hypothetical protein
MRPPPFSQRQAEQLDGSCASATQLTSGSYALQVAEAMKPFLYTSFGNPSSIHTYGQEVRQQQAACGTCDQWQLGLWVP